jgi:single-strand DNA-binding protein
MGSYNRVTLMGNLGNDVELRATATGGQPVSNFSIATNEGWTDKEGVRQERTEWHRIVVFGPQAALCAKYLGKGSSCLVEGRLQTREWLDKDGVAHLQTEVVASSVQFLTRKKGAAADVGGATGEVPAESSGGAAASP